MRDDRLALGLLVLGALALAGMLLGTWQLVLYPSLLFMGVLLALALGGRTAGIAVGLPAGVTALLVVLFAVLHGMGIAAPPGSGSVLGWDPMTALYLFGVGPAFVLVGLLFGLVNPSLSRPGAPADEEMLR